MTAPSNTDDLFFEPLVRGYVADNPRFVRRDWLAKELDGKLGEAGKRFVLLTAEPGAGKSTFMAQLAHDRADWLRYFIRRDQRSPLADVSDKSLLLRIGYQLAARRPELFTLDAIRLSVVQTIGSVDAQGEVVGAEIKRLTASPFYQKVLQIDQRVRSSAGRVVALRVEELNVETRLLTVEDLLELALIAPARAQQRTDPSQRIVILIDALDEIRYHPGTENSILAWLTNCPDLPNNVRFVLSSRPPDDALNLFRSKQADRLADLAIAEGDTNVTQDVQTFVTRLVGEPAIREALRASADGANGFARKAADKAHGNLGYLDALARGIDQAIANDDAEALAALFSLKVLPTGLAGLFAFFLNQIKVSVARERIELTDPETGATYDKPFWPTVYSPMLGMFAVAQEPLSLDLIVRLGGIRAEREWVSGAIERLAQFLDIIDGRYRLYHPTMGEFLTATQTRDSTDPPTAALYQDPLKRHQRIAEYYWTTYQADWSKCDDYGLRNLAGHLYALRSDVTYRTQLYEFVSRSVVVAKWRRFGSLDSLAADLMMAMNAAVQEKPLYWSDFMRCYLLERTFASFELRTDLLCSIASSAAPNDPPEHARKLVDQALAGASRLQASAEKARTLSTIAAFLFNTGAKEDAQEVVNRAVAETQLINNVQEQSETLSAIVLNMARVHNVEGAKDVACRALAIAQSGDFSWGRAISISSAARALSQVGETELARDAFSQALVAAWDVKDNDDRAYALCAVAAAMELAGDKDAEYVFRDAGSQLYGLGIPPEEIEDEFNSIYIDCRAKSGDPEALFAVALGIRDRSQRSAALHSLAERMAKMVLYGDHSRPPGGDLDIDRLCDRATFLSIASEEADPSIVGQRKFTLRGLCHAILGVELE